MALDLETIKQYGISVMDGGDIPPYDLFLMRRDFKELGVTTVYRDGSLLVEAPKSKMDDVTEKIERIKNISKEGKRFYNVESL